jgi:hypothetical protein
VFDLLLVPNLEAVFPDINGLAFGPTGFANAESSRGATTQNIGQSISQENFKIHRMWSGFAKLFEVILALVFDVLPFFAVGVHRGSWSKTWKSKVQPFCTHWLA